jgi:anti-sigma regulatory factor (Ser/Thr protein kinase)
MVEWEIPHDVAAPRLARRWLTEKFADRLDVGELGRARLLISELVTNAVIHGRGSITTRATLEDDRLVVEVLDQGQEFGRPEREYRANPTGSSGLAIVDAEASRWGFHGGVTRAWFELRR